jgi:erythromycin esterase-like protein
MAQPTPTYGTLDDWIAHAATPFALDAPAGLAEAADQVLAAAGSSLKLLGLGETLHFGEEMLTLRNRLFQYLVEAHGFTAIAIESSFPRGRLVNDYVAGRSGEDYAAIQDAGFSHGFGRLAANRELVEWMRTYNAAVAPHARLRFYGFDTPTEMMNSDSPRQALMVVLDYLIGLDPAAGQAQRDRIEPLFGDDAAWENMQANMDPSQSIGRSPAAATLRVAVEDLAAGLAVRRPDLIAKSGPARYLEAVHYAAVARHLLAYHAAVADNAGVATLLGMRDAAMADNLLNMVTREAGKVLAFAHNSHLRRGMAQWQLGAEVHTWWPAGAPVAALLGPTGYAVIGTGLGESPANGIGQPEAGTLEARLTATPGPGRLIPTYRGEALPAAEVARLPTRAGSLKNPSYFALTPQSLADFDWLAVLDASAYAEGAPPLPDWTAST